MAKKSIAVEKAIKLANSLFEQGKVAKAKSRMVDLLSKHPQNIQVYYALGVMYKNMGDLTQSLYHLEQGLKLDEQHVPILTLISQNLSSVGKRKMALEYAEKAAAISPNSVDVLTVLSSALIENFKFSEGKDALEKAHSLSPENATVLASLGHAYEQTCDFANAHKFYRLALKASPNSPSSFSNIISTNHYNPAWNSSEMLTLADAWQKQFLPLNIPPRPKPANLNPQRKLRIGLLSDGLRRHPVGYMISNSIELLPDSEFDLVAFSTNDIRDDLSIRLHRIVDSWHPIRHLQGSVLAKFLREQQLDILIDLSGYMGGTRFTAIGLEPAPLIMKWVGGLINTTGLKAFDYLLSDHVQTPEGVDSQYSENLIRLPDGYVCYEPPLYAPDVGPLPALTNGFVTFGCFNNAMKLNEELLTHWADILKAVPNAKLLLKSHKLQSGDLVTRFTDILIAAGVAADQVIFEGPSGHPELLNTYNKIDIALDTWPYSGGLTTCEALYMGVPVVTLPGPTFAGRHSATHLTNVGLSELVTDSWEELKAKSIGLASDLDNLKSIRENLRTTVLRSPLTDQKRFAKNLSSALRAIWARYCENKAPAPLSFNEQGACWFVGDEGPVNLVTEAPKRRVPRDIGDGSSHFNWELQSRVVAFDNSTRLVRSPAFKGLRNLDAFSVVAFDPSSQINDLALYEGSDDVQVFQHAQLGNGEMGNLHAVMDANLSSVLKPLATTQLPEELQFALTPLTTLPINTIALDSIEGLPSLDVLVLDHLSPCIDILNHGQQALANTLLIQCSVAETITHEAQVTIDALEQWATNNGFEVLIVTANASKLLLQTSSAVVVKDVVLVPSEERLDTMTPDQLSKLGFIAHTLYREFDFAYELLKRIDDVVAETYRSVNSTQQPKTFTIPEQPHMTDSERELFKKYLSQANEYYEFGAGGSTVWAVERGLVAHGIESDLKWVMALREKLGENCQTKFVDIGPTGDWGYPTSLLYADRFPHYSKAIWNYELPFDLILVDGRFRVACVLSSVEYLLAKHPNPTTAYIFIHDFWNRQNNYSAVLDFLECVEQSESAGVFKIKDRLVLSEVQEAWEKYAKNPA